AAYVPWPTRPRGPCRRLVRIGLQPSDELAQIVRGHSMLRGDQPGRDARQRYGLEIFDDVVWEIVDGAVDDLRGPGSVKKRIAIGRGARDPAHAERSRGAGHVLNYHGLAEARSHTLGDARDRIHLATGGGRNDYAPPAGGSRGRRFDARRDWQCGGSCGEAQKAAARKFHLLPGGVAPAEYHPVAPTTSSSSGGLNRCPWAERHRPGWCPTRCGSPRLDRAATSR